MKREAFMLAGLLVGSYGAFLWLTAPSHGTDVAKSSVAPTPAVNIEVHETVPTEAEPSTSQPSGTTHVAEFDSLTAADSPGEESVGPGGDEAQPTIQDAGSAPADALLRRAHASDPTAIQTLSQGVQPGNDRQTRLAAVQALLRIGRQSHVDPAVTAALKRATEDADSSVSAEANSALVEVERAMH